MQVMAMAQPIGKTFLKNREQVAKRVRKANYTFNAARDRCLLCGKNFLHACSSHSLDENLAALARVRKEDGK
jgi:hypothetical protein